LSGYARSITLLLILSMPLLSDPITVTILNQTTLATARTEISGSSLACDNTGLRAATCNISASPTHGIAVAEASIGGYQALLAVATGTDSSGYAFATASLTDTLLITGGTGIGYLNLVFADTRGGSYNQPGYLVVNGQTGKLPPIPYGNAEETVSGVFSFQFGQPFDYTISLQQTTDPSDTGAFDRTSFVAAKIYSTQPTSCGFNFQTSIYGICADPNFVSAPILGVVVPEPNSFFLLAGAALFLLLLSRRVSSARC
jgi:hypothetical protein